MKSSQNPRGQIKVGQIYFVRHGESVANELGVFAGTMDVALTEFGELQAKKTAQAIVALDLKFDQIHRSDLQRVVRTCDLIREYSHNTAAKVTVSAQLNERDFGVFTAKNKTLLRRAVGYDAFETAVHSFAAAPPTGESLQEIYDRVHRYYFEHLLPQKEQGQVILVVCSKYVIEMFAMVSLGLSSKDYFDFKLPNSKPLSEESLKNYVAKQSRGFKHVADRLSHHSTAFLLLSGIAGFLASQTQVHVAPVVSSVVGVVALIIMTFMASLIIDTKKAKTELYSPRAISYWILRVAAGVGLLIFLPKTFGLQLLGALLIVPPPSSLPSIAIMLGGNGYTALGVTALGTLASLFAAGLFAPHIAFQTFGVSIFFGCVLPLIATRVLRYYKPTVARALAEKWGFVSVPAFGVFLFLHFGTHGAELSASLTQKAFIEAVAALIVFKLLALISASGSIDRYLGHATPNLILLGAFLPSAQSVLFSGLILATLWIDESAIQFIFNLKFRRLPFPKHQVEVTNN